MSFLCVVHKNKKVTAKKKQTKKKQGNCFSIQANVGPNLANSKVQYSLIYTERVG